MMIGVVVYVATAPFGGPEGGSSNDLVGWLVALGVAAVVAWMVRTRFGEAKRPRMHLATGVGSRWGVGLRLTLAACIVVTLMTFVVYFAIANQGHSVP